MSDPHPAILKVRAHHGGTVARLRANYFSDQPLPKVAQADWVPKNPNVDWPPMTKETSMCTANMPFTVRCCSHFGRRTFHPSGSTWSLV